MIVVCGKTTGLRFVSTDKASWAQPNDKDPLILHFWNLCFKVDLILSGKYGLVLHEQIQEYV